MRVTLIFEYLTSPAGIGTGGNRVGVVAVLTAVSGCAAGATVGGVGDILAYLRKAISPRECGLEADYVDPPIGGRLAHVCAAGDAALGRSRLSLVEKLAAAPAD